MRLTKLEIVLLLVILAVIVALNHRIVSRQRALEAERAFSEAVAFEATNMLNQPTKETP